MKKNEASSLLLSEMMGDLKSLNERSSFATYISYM